MTVSYAKMPAPVWASPVAYAERGNVHLIDQLADEWRDLCSRSKNDEPFYRPEWIGAYLQAFAPAARVLVVTVRSEGRLLLVLPLIEETCTFSGVPVRRLRAPANSHPGRFDLICDSGPEGDAAIRAAWECLRNLKGWDLLELSNVPEDGACERLAAAARTDGASAVRVLGRGSPYILVPASAECANALPRNARLRTKLRQARRELATDGELRLSCIEAQTPSALHRFYELEGSGWKNRERSAIKNAANTLKFYNEVAEAASRFEYFALYMLEWNGHLIAAHFSLLYGGRCYSPKVAYDENFDRLAPGHLIVAEILRDCAARNIKVFDITGPDDEWKLKWTADVRRIYDHYVFNGKLGGLARAVRFGIQPAVGRLLRRLRNRA